jgi:hypothetical protein
LTRPGFLYQLKIEILARLRSLFAAHSILRAAGQFHVAADRSANFP